MDAVIRLMFPFGMLLLAIGTVCLLCFTFYPRLADHGIEYLGPYGDYFGGTIGTAVALMNTGAFLVLTYAVAAAQQRNHHNQIKTQALNHADQQRLQIQTHLFEFRMAKLEDFKTIQDRVRQELDSLFLGKTYGDMEYGASSYGRSAVKIGDALFLDLNPMKKLFDNVDFDTDLRRFRALCVEIDEMLSDPRSPDRVTAINRTVEAMRLIHGIKMKFEDVTFRGLNS